MFPNSDPTAASASSDMDPAALALIANQQLYKGALELLVRITGGLFHAAQQTRANWRPESVPAPVTGDPLNAALNYHAYNLSMHEVFVLNLAKSLAPGVAPEGADAGLEKIDIM